ncbi:MAG: glycosyltransferase family 4 protein, partial [Candidatus Aenigmatarchaeota archaeon]
MGKMKVCLLSRYPPHKGGIATHAKALAEGLRRRGHDVTLITYGRLGRKEEGMEIIEVPVINLFFLRGLSYFIGAMLALRKLKRRIDVVHAHPIHPAGTAAVISKKFTDAPVVITSHGSDLEKWAKKPFGKFLFSRVVNSSDVLICVSNALADLARDTGIDESKIRVVPNGMELPEEIRSAGKALLREKLGLPAGKKIVLYAGMLEEIKNPQEFLLCAERLANY